MHYVKLFFVPIMCVSLCISAEVRLLRQAEINKKIAGIEKQIIRDSRLSLG
jgi:hypothetical protein